MSSAALMFPPHTVRVGDAVTLHILQTERFKTARLSISAILPADQVLSPRMTLLFGVLRRGSSRFPSQLHINRRLDELYGATLTIRNFHAGDRQVLDDSCLPAADRGLDILGGVADLLAGLILEPLTDEDGVLRRRSVEQEKQALCDAILADRNQARSYAEGRMRHILYGQEPSGVSPGANPGRDGGAADDAVAVVSRLRAAGGVLCGQGFSGDAGGTLAGGVCRSPASLPHIAAYLASCCAACAAPRGRSAQSLTGAAVHGVVIGYHPVRKQATAASRHPVQ